nr:lasso peptide biosynthesis B2 protein [uncultured Draconibacterium sp.]
MHGLLIPPDKLTRKPNTLLLTEVRNAILRVNKTTVWKNGCLVESLAVSFMLQRRGIASVMYLGLQIDKESEKKLKAHAWLISENITITPNAGNFKEVQ